MTKVSVILPVHNTNIAYLKEAIESILNQTFTDFEFIIIDDSKTNAQQNVIKQYSDTRIIYRNLESLSISDALNYGINLAKGEYIARMDADDISLPTRFEKQVKFLDNNVDYSVVGSWFEIFPKKCLIKHPKTPKLLDFFTGCYIAHPTVMFRKADFDKYNLRYSNKFYCEDYDLWSRAARYLKFYNLQESLLLYRESNDNKSNQCLQKLDEDSNKVKDNILDFLTDDNLINEHLMILRNVITQKQKIKPPTFLQKFFSIRTEFSGFKKFKVVRFFGLKISVKESW